MTGASLTATYVVAAAPASPGASDARSVIRIRMIGSWLVWLGGLWHAYTQC